MSEETLFTAARRVVRNFNIDMNRGGLITVETESAVETLNKYVRLHETAEKARAAAEAKDVEDKK